MFGSGAGATIRLQHGIGCAELTSICRARPLVVAGRRGACLATLASHHGGR
jgi:hypothetical protein